MLTMERDLQAFEDNLPTLLKGCEGQWVVIRDGEVRKVLPSYTAALDWAYSHFELECFFVKQVVASEPDVHFFRHAGACAR